jgi:hypothetical protein
VLRVLAILAAVLLATPIASYLWNQLHYPDGLDSLWSWWTDALPHVLAAPLDVAASGTPLALGVIVAWLGMLLSDARGRHQATAEAPTPTTMASAKTFGDDETRVARPLALEHDRAATDTAHDSTPTSARPDVQPSPPDDRATGPFGDDTRPEPPRAVAAHDAESLVKSTDHDNTDADGEPSDATFDDETRRVAPEQTPFGSPTRQADADSYGVVQGLSALEEDDQDDS